MWHMNIALSMSPCTETVWQSLLLLLLNMLKTNVIFSVVKWHLKHSLSKSVSVSAEFCHIQSSSSFFYPFCLLSKTTNEWKEQSKKSKSFALLCFAPSFYYATLLCRKRQILQTPELGRGRYAFWGDRGGRNTTLHVSIWVINGNIKGRGDVEMP